ncbi:MAG: 4Fe-4S dicluster domain-containing protein [Candidatus Helarchaeales archaeon]
MPVPEIAMKPVEGTNQVKYIKRFLITKTELYYDPDKCINCNLCLNTCPKEAMVYIPEGSPEFGPGPVGVDLDKCILCGICSYVCSTGALQLKIDDEPKLLLRENLSLPALEPVMKKSKDDKNVRKYLSGSLRINVDKCPEDCDLCIKACPMNVIEFTSLKKDRRAKLNLDDCIFCYACKRDCPVPDEAIILDRSRILWNEEDEFSSPFVEIIEKLMGQAAKSKFLRDYSIKVIDQRGMDLYRSEIIKETK